MKTVYKNIIVTGVLALATTSLYAGGNKTHCHDAKSCSLREYNRQSVTVVRPLSASLEMFQDRYVNTSKGIRLDTGDRLAAREEVRSHRHVRVLPNDREWTVYNVERNQRIDSNSTSKDPERNPG